MRPVWHGAAPDANPQRTRIVLVCRANEQLRAVRAFPRADRGHAVIRLARFCHGEKLCRRGKIRRVFQKICPHLGVGGEVAADQIFARLGFQPGGIRGDLPFDLEFTGVNQKAHERFLIVRLVGNVSKNEHARFFLRIGGAGKQDAKGEGSKKFGHWWGMNFLPFEPPHFFARKFQQFCAAKKTAGVWRPRQLSSCERTRFIAPAP